MNPTHWVSYNCVHRGVKGKVDPAGTPHVWCGALVALLSPLEGQELYKVGGALTDLNDLEQDVCKVREHCRGGKKKKKKTKQRKRCLGYSETDVAGFGSHWSCQGKN